MTRRLRTGFGLFPRIVVFLAAVLVPLAVVTWYVSVRTLRERMSEEFASKGTAIANGLASAGVDLVLTRDASTVQALVDQYVSISGVEYVMVYDTQRRLLAHTFHPVVPADLIAQNLVPGEAAKQVRSFTYRHPVTGARRSVIDVGVPMLAGQVGTVRVGMDRAIIDRAAARSGWFLLGVFGGVAVLAVAAGAIFARRITRPVAEIVRVAERVGGGDLSQTVEVSGRDEIALLAHTFNDTVIRLRSQLLTEAERDEERRRRQELQRNITLFLETVTEIARGDLRRRGQVTPDVLGSVVDAVNVMVEEISALLVDVRHAALRVAAGAGELVGTADQLAQGAEAQARYVKTVSDEVEAMTGSMRLVADRARASATAAGQALQAATRGEEAVRDSLRGMQRIRSEVKVIAKRIKSLGDRSLEISRIVHTIDEIAAHTDLLSLNAAIEAAGAGEAGLRFAVVADEIRKLAERSATATRDIAALIRAVQVETQEAVTAMEEGTREVEAGYRVTMRAEDSLKEIAGVARSSADMAQEISGATQAQARGADGVAAAMRSIAEVAVHTEQAVLQTRRTVDELAKVAEELTHSLARFTLA